LTNEPGRPLLFEGPQAGTKARSKLRLSLVESTIDELEAKHFSRDVCNAS